MDGWALVMFFYPFSMQEVWLQEEFPSRTTYVKSGAEGSNDTYLSGPAIRMLIGVDKNYSESPADFALWTPTESVASIGLFYASVKSTSTSMRFGRQPRTSWWDQHATKEGKN